MFGAGCLRCCAGRTYRSADNHASDPERECLLRAYNPHGRYGVECRRWFCARAVAGPGNYWAEHYIRG